MIINTKTKKPGFMYLIVIIVLLFIIISFTSNSIITGFAAEDNKTKDKENKTLNESSNATNQIVALNESSANVTGSEAINEAAKIKKEKDKNKTEENVTQQLSNKSITINAEYKSGTIYDSDDNGYESTGGVIDLTVENSRFNWNADVTKLCTRWSTYSIDYNESTTVCYGSKKCCNFIGLGPLRENWNEVFYATYGQYGAGLNNVVSAQVIYVDYSLSIEEPFAEIYYSDWENLTANFYFSTIDFKNVCVDTCTLSGFNLSSYNLIFEITDATLHLDALAYSIAEEPSKVFVDLAVKDNEGAISGSYKLYKENVPITEEFVVPDYYNIEITPRENIIDKLVIENANITKPLIATIGIDKIDKEIYIKDVYIKYKGYAVYLEKIGFEKAILTKTATSNALYECRQWDFAREVCFGTWEKINDLIPGQQYELTLARESIGFIEGNLNITLENITLVNITNITELFLANNISNININVNNNSTINLSNYFLNIDNNTTFAYYNQNNISIIFNNKMATIVPEKDFAGTRYTFITANKSGYLAVSNLFSINVEKITENVMPMNLSLINITDPLIQLKLKEYSDLHLKPDFKYNTIEFIGYEIKNEVVIMYITVDGKNIRWLTSSNNFKDIISK